MPLESDPPRGGIPKPVEKPGGSSRRSKGGKKKKDTPTAPTILRERRRKIKTRGRRVVWRFPLKNEN